MNDLFKFLASFNGRIARVVAGVVLVILGLLIGGTVGWIIVIIGLVPLVAGALDVCVFAPLFGLAFRGADLRAELEQKSDQPQ